MIKKIDIITSTCIPLPQENVDTDQIIPARFLKAVSREGFGENLFRSDLSISVGELGSLLDHSGPIGEGEKYSVAVPAVNMLLGLLPDMDSK